MFTARKNIPYFVILIFLVFTPSIVSAAKYCTSSESEYVLNLGHIFVGSDTSPGDVLFVDTHIATVTCNAPSAIRIKTAGATNTAWASSGLTVSLDGLNSCAVIDQGTALSDMGIGIVWTNYNSAANAWQCMTPAIIGRDQIRGLKTTGITQYTDKVYLIKLDKELQYGSSGEMSQTVFVDEENNGFLYSFSFNGAVTATVGGCSVVNNTNVDMGMLSISTFSGIGSAGVDVPFNIHLQQCYGAAVRAHFDFTPVYGFADESGNIIALNDNDNAATGVGIQLQYNAAGVNELGNYIYPIAQGDNTIPLIARYVQTNEVVTPGRADSTLVFNVYYD
ncbi:MAG TPA: fimbrial protein [Buttiauxella sp.]|jgi:type 1 fimbria pilin